MTDCTHPRFLVDAHVNRIVEEEGGKVSAYLLRVALHCTVCEAHFWFPGLGTGLSYAEPTTTPEGFLVTLPVVPEGERCDPHPRLASVAIRNNDIHKGHRGPKAP